MGFSLCRFVSEEIGCKAWGNFSLIALYYGKIRLICTFYGQLLEKKFNDDFGVESVEPVQCPLVVS